MRENLPQSDILTFKDRRGRRSLQVLLDFLPKYAIIKSKGGENVPQKRKKYKKRPPKKIYDIKQLKEKWKQQRFNEKKYYAKMGTVAGIVGMVALIGFAVLCFICANHQPIEYDQAISYSAQFEKYYTRYNFKGGSKECIKFTNQDSKSLPDFYFFGNQNPNADLETLAKGTTLNLKLHPDGEILEIKAGDKEILNFDYAQKQLQKRSICVLVFGILAALGVIPCVMYTYKKIFKEKVFSRAVQLYK